MNDQLTAKAVVAALDEHIVGQNDAKRGRGGASQPMAAAAALA